MRVLHTTTFNLSRQLILGNKEKSPGLRPLLQPRIMEKSDGSLPTYEESIGQGSNPDPKLPRGQQIIDDITISRSQNISYVAGKHVIPEVERRAREGQAKTVIVLLPSDIVPQDEESSSYGKYAWRRWLCLQEALTIQKGLNKAPRSSS